MELSDPIRSDETTGETTPVIAPACASASLAVELESSSDHPLEVTPPLAPVERPTSERPTSERSTSERVRPPSPRTPGYWILTRLLPVLALILVIGWAGIRISALTTPRRPKDAPPPETIIISANDQPVNNAEDGEDGEDGDTYDDDDDTEDGAPIPGEKLGSLLSYKVERYDAKTGESAPIRLAEGPLRSGAVTVVNLWATWCEACKEEFPGFQTIYVRGQRESGWGPEVRFVTLMLNDHTFASSAYGQYKDDLPPDTEFLVDQKLDPVEKTLKEKSLLPETGDLPVTFLLDCRRRVRWHRKGALSGADFAELDQEIRALRDDLGTPRCKKKKKREKPASTLPPKPLPNGHRSACNRDKTCDPDESTASCPVDCPPDIFH